MLFFEQYPHYRGRFTFVQIAVPTRGDVEVYRQYRELIRATVDEINKRYGFASSLGSISATRWRPIELREGRIGIDSWQPITGWPIWRWSVRCTTG